MSANLSGNEVSIWCAGARRTFGRAGAIAHCREMLTLDVDGRDWWRACLSMLEVAR